jgi:hypothetical protein
VQRRQPGRRGDTGGVENQPAERIGPAAAQIGAHHVVILVQRRTQRLDNPARTADQQLPGQRRIAYPVPPEFLGLWNSELLGEKRAGPGVDDLGE